MDQVLLDVPSSLDFLHVVRAVVSGVAASRNLSYESIETICLTASEAAAGLLTAAKDAERLRLRMGVEDTVVITLTVEGAEEKLPGPVTWDPLAWRLLSVLALRLDSLDEDGQRGIRIVLRP